MKLLKNLKLNCLISKLRYSIFKKLSSLLIRQFAVLFLFSVAPLLAQTPESENAQSFLGRIWGGFTAVGDNANFNKPSLFFPNDFDLIYSRGQSNDNYFGGGFRLAATDWLAPDDSLYRAAVFGPKSQDYLPNGKVTVPLTNYLRYQYPTQTINGVSVPVPLFGTHNPGAMTEGTYDQVLESTYKNIIGVEVKRKVMIWSQSFNDNYVMIDVELTNVGVDGQTPDTLRNFYFMMQMGTSNNYYSNTNYNAPQSNETPKYLYTWQHYYGARPGDSLRVFYSYSADDPTVSGDDMGSPIISQNGRLVNTNFIFNTILHASKEPYLDPALDENDPLQPKITYIGTDTKIPDLSSTDDPGGKNYWAIRGGFSATQLMPGSYEGTYHYINNDELGIADFSNFVGGTTSSTNSKNYSSFGPYTFPPNYKIRIVYAQGVAGIGLETAQEVGMKWLNGTLDNPPDMPDPNTGWLPSNFEFPSGATEQDKRKDRWVSMGLDSVMLTAYRAKWNFEHNYKIPQAPPPPNKVAVTGYGDTGVDIVWSDSEAESLPNFAGYRIMRKLSNQDTVFYKEVYSSGPDDKAPEHRFTDDSIIKTVPYYYYIQAKVRIDENDLTADPTTRGEIIYSGRCLVPNASSIRPPNFSTEDMSKIRVLPNPYNINDPLVRANYATTDYRQINFVNLPVTVTIKIYTENGDLVKTIEHNQPNTRDGFEHWDMITDNQQVISSGIYIAVFQKPTGETSYQKFIVVR
jgi:hypothetical protein